MLYPFQGKVIRSSPDVRKTASPELQIRQHPLRSRCHSAIGCDVLDSVIIWVLCVRALKYAPAFRNWCFRAGVAQLVEHLICNQRVGGSNPFASSSKCGLSFSGKRRSPVRQQYRASKSSKQGSVPSLIAVSPARKFASVGLLPGECLGWVQHGNSGGLPRNEWDRRLCTGGRAVNGSRL